MRRLVAAVGSHWRTIVASSLLLGTAVIAAVLLWPRPAPPLTVIAPTPRPTASPLPTVVVHVSGAVASPGVYRLPPGARAEDAISAAGGLTEEADPSSLNLAARLADGQQVLVGSRVAHGGPGSMTSSDARAAGKVNLNAASLADLDTLPGIGPALAQRIIERRQRSGPFQTIEQLRDEKILPAATYERVKDLVTVN